MNKTLLIKRALLYTVFFICMLVLMAMDSICDTGCFFGVSCVVIALIYVCYKNINKAELEKILSHKRD